jgi:hypothetical protein
VTYGTSRPPLTCSRLGAGELRKALAEVVREAVAKGWVYAGKAEGWLEKLERRRVLMEGWPKYLVRRPVAARLRSDLPPQPPTA